ncbi:unnamed protein product, partial [Dovyalis caffra]
EMTFCKALVEHSSTETTFCIGLVEHSICYKNWHRCRRNGTLHGTSGAFEMISKLMSLMGDY